MRNPEKPIPGRKGRTSRVHSYQEGAVNQDLRHPLGRAGVGEAEMRIMQRFFRDEAATAEATSTVMMIAAVGILIISGLVIWYTGLNGAFNTAAKQVSPITTGMYSTM